MRKTRSGYDLGNPISLEDALSIMIVTFVLFVLFLIPLVNIDKMKLEEAQRDTYWETLSNILADCPRTPADAVPYLQAFGLEGHRICISEAGEFRYVEALSSTGDITVIQHDKDSYISFLVKGQSAVVTYRLGDIRWSSAEQEWFTANNTIDYGEKALSLAMQKAYREWTMETRGF